MHESYGGIASVAQILNTPTARILPGQPLMVPLKKVNCWQKTLQPVKVMCLSALQLGAKKLSSKIIRVSNELLQDSGVDIEASWLDVLPTHWTR
jgi:hypothetical protein